MAIEYRICNTNEEYAAVKALEMQIWQMSPGDAITVHMMHVITHTGGLILGAYDEGRMVALGVAVATHNREQLWSHMAGVHPDYQGQGIGSEIKQIQRQWALNRGYTEMRWTFDPAMRGNAHFNLRLLGAKTNIYHYNFYGEVFDGINAGVATDRFEAIWSLTDDSPAPEPPAKPVFLLALEDDRPVVTGDATERYHAIMCPYDFPATKAADRDLAIAWRTAMRTACQAAFERGYFAVDFVTDRYARQCWYILRRD